MVKVPPLRKLVIECRFRPTLDFYQLMDHAAKEFLSGYPDWQRSALTVEVKDIKRHRRIYFSGRRLFVEYDFVSAPKNIDDAVDEASKELEKACNLIGLSILDRLGTRLWFAADVKKSFAALVDDIAERFTLQSELSSVLPHTLSDVAYVAHFDIPDSWKYSLRVGAMTRNEWFEKVPHEAGLYDADPENAEDNFERFRLSFPESLVHVDIDCHDEKVKVAELRSRVTDFRRVAGEITANIIKRCEK